MGSSIKIAFSRANAFNLDYAGEAGGIGFDTVNGERRAVDEANCVKTDFGTRIMGLRVGVVVGLTVGVSVGLSVGEYVGHLVGE